VKEKAGDSPHSLLTASTSVSESDFGPIQERKVGLTVESQFDPNEIKKAQVVLGELLGGTAAICEITPQYERIARAMRSFYF